MIGETTVVGGCTMKSGAKSHYHWTTVRSSLAPGCPKSIEFEYLDPDEGEIQNWNTPLKVQICGGAPVGVRVKKP